MLEIICVTYGQNECLKCLINSIKSQTSDNWFLRIIHDGQGEKYEALKKDLKDNDYLSDQVLIEAVPERMNNYGHSSRDFGLQNPVRDSDWVLQTNGDNYYLPTFVEAMEEIIEAEEKAGFIFCNYIQKLDHLIHPVNRDKFFSMDNQIKEGWIDVGSAIVRTDVARKVGFKHVTQNGDYLYFMDCLEALNKLSDNAIIKTSEYLYVHT